MPKKETAEVVRQVAEVLTQKPKTISEIAEEADVSWEGAKRALGLLVDLGVAVAEREGRRIKYKKGRAGRVRGYFEIPVGKEDRKKIRNAYGLIRKVWKETAGKEPTRTQVYKTLAKINREFKLGIPMGRYLYGEIAPLPYGENEEYPVPSGGKWTLVEGYIKNLAGTYGGRPVQQMLEEHYKENGLKAHLVRMQVATRLARVSKGDVPRIAELLTQMIVELDDRESREYLAEFIGYVNNLVFAGEIDDKLRTVVADAFDSIWRYAATKMYYDDISKFYRDVEIWKLAAEIEQRKTEMMDLLTLLREIVIEFTPKPPEDKELSELQGSAKD